jgi:putative addiction module killer protein
MKPMSAVQVSIYQTESGKVPFEKWLRRLDGVTKSRILGRIRRLSTGGMGDWKSVGGGVFEMRLDFGPGYRLYFGMTDEGKLVVILCGGDKSSQDTDIKNAQLYWENWKERA